MKKAPALPTGATDTTANHAALFAYLDSRASHSLLDYLLNGFKVGGIPRGATIGRDFAIIAHKAAQDGGDVVTIWNRDHDIPRKGPLLEIRRDAHGQYQMQADYLNPYYRKLRLALN